MKNNITPSKKHILLCSPYSGAIGGISRWTNHIMLFYKQKADSVDINLELFDMARSYPTQSQNHIFRRILYGIIDYRSLLKTYKKKLNSKFDIMHLTSSASYSLLKDILMLKAANKKGIYSIIHFRFGRIPEILESNNWENKLLTLVIRLASCVIVIDKASYQALLNKGFNNIILLPNPLSPEIARIEDSNKGIKRCVRKIVFAGHVVETKGVFELIDVCKSIPNIEVRIIGAITKEMRSRIASISDEETYKWLHVAGEYTYEETIKEMLSAGIFVLPTYTEGFPNVILESMACACPIIASSVGAIPEMLNIGNNDECGICIEPKNKVQLKKAIETMLEDRDFADRCAANAKNRVHQLYSMDNIWNKLTEIWTSSTNEYINK